VDPTVEKILNVGAAERHAVQQADHALATRRLADTSLHGLKVVEAVTAKELLVSDDPTDYARINGAVRTPTTLDHPNAVVGK